MWGQAENISELLILSKLEPNNIYFVFRFKVNPYAFSSLTDACSLFTLCAKYLPQKLRRFPRRMSAWALGRRSRVMHQNVQIRAKGHFLPQFVKHNSNNNNEVWFYKERGRLDMLVWFPAREAGQDSGSQDGLWTDERVERRCRPLFGSP